MFISGIRIIFFTIVLALLTGVIYPLAVTAISQALFPKQANGSLIEQNGKIIGSSLIAQKFERLDYFHPRPSGAGAGYEANNSGASNLSVTSKKLIYAFQERLKTEQAIKGTADKVPVDLITASGSGLDPDITPENAQYQAGRIALKRGLAETDVLKLIEEHIESRTFGALGQRRVNVLELNLALDKMENLRNNETLP